LSFSSLAQPDGEISMKPSVFVTRAIPEAGLARVREVCDVDLWPGEMPPPYEELVAHTRGKDGLLCLLTDRIDAALMDAGLPTLKVISQMAVGYDNIQAAEAHKRGIALGNTPGVLTEATADLAFALLLASARRIVEGVDYIRQGQWVTWHPTTLLGGDLSGATLGIIGLGRIGQAVVRRASGFNMRIIAHSPRANPADAATQGVELLSMDDLLRRADYISLHVPLNASTRHLIGARELSLMKDGATLINTTRGPVVDQAALVAALQTGRIRAALDVTDPEPLPADHPLMSLPNAIVVPHIGSASRWARDQMALMAAENLIAGVTGQPLPTAVRP
jgi:lactate dehydrogenase-like 2-hydroxyacid dehydrogenase